MSTLHLINRPGTLKVCIDAVTRGDSLLFYESGVLACTAAGFVECLDALDGIDTFALDPDVAAAGIGNRLDPRIVRLDDAGFVDLVVRHHKTVSWS
jgi:sulfur relay protein TusB/DsrH